MNRPIKKIPLKQFINSYEIIPRGKITNIVLKADAQKHLPNNPFNSGVLFNDAGYIFVDEKLFLDWLIQNLPLRVTYRYLESIGKF